MFSVLLHKDKKNFQIFLFFPLVFFCASYTALGKKSQLGCGFVNVMNRTPYVRKASSSCFDSISSRQFQSNIYIYSERQFWATLSFPTSVLILVIQNCTSTVYWYTTTKLHYPNHKNAPPMDAPPHFRHP